MKNLLITIAFFAVSYAAIGQNTTNDTVEVKRVALIVNDEATAVTHDDLRQIMKDYPTLILQEYRLNDRSLFYMFREGDENDDPKWPFETVKL